MKYGILGTGMVGKALAGKLKSLGHDVMMGTRSADTSGVQQWVEEQKIRLGTFAEAAAFGETLISCTAGATSIDVLRSVDPSDLNSKVLIDVSNPLDASHG